MGGVDLWQNEDETYENFDPQSMHDKIVEVVSISGTWHLGKLQVMIMIVLQVLIAFYVVNLTSVYFSPHIIRLGYLVPEG